MLSSRTRSGIPERSARGARMSMRVAACNGPGQRRRGCVIEAHGRIGHTCTFPLHYRPAARRLTLLAAILGQNPRFRAGMTSPVGLLFDGLLGSLSAGSEFAPVTDEAARRPRRRTSR
jgi:hypothetical protein